MNWKLVAIVALAALFSVSACKKKKDEKKAEPTPTAEPAGDPAGEPTAEPAAAPEPTFEDPLQAKFYECWKAMIPEGTPIPPDVADQVKQGAEAMAAGAAALGEKGAEALKAAMDACKDVACANGEWQTCFGTKLAEAVTAAAAPPPPDPNAAPAAGTATEAYLAKTIECAKEMAGPAWTAEMEAQTKTAFEQAGAAWAAMGEGINDMINKALEACKDKPCAGGEWMTCSGTELANAMAAGAGVPPVAP